MATDDDDDGGGGDDDDFLKAQASPYLAGRRRLHIREEKRGWVYFWEPTKTRLCTFGVLNLQRYTNHHSTTTLPGTIALHA